MNKMHNLQNRQQSAPPPPEYSLTVCLFLIYYRVKAVIISIVYSHH